MNRRQLLKTALVTVVAGGAGLVAAPPTGSSAAPTKKLVSIDHATDRRAAKILSEIRRRVRVEKATPQDIRTYLKEFMSGRAADDVISTLDMWK